MRAGLGPLFTEVIRGEISEVVPQVFAPYLSQALFSPTSKI